MNIKKILKDMAKYSVRGLYILGSHIIPANEKIILFESGKHVPLKRHVYRIGELYYVCKVKGTKETRNRNKEERKENRMKPERKLK